MIKTIKGTLFLARGKAPFVRRRKEKKDGHGGWTRVAERRGEVKEQTRRERERERVDLESGAKDGVKMEGEKYGWDGVTGIPTPVIRSTLLLGRSSGNSRCGGAISIPKFRIPEARAANFLRSIILVPLARGGEGGEERARGSRFYPRDLQMEIALWSGRPLSSPPFFFPPN